MNMYLVNLKMGKLCALKATRYTFKNEMEEGKFFKENTTGTFKTIRFAKFVASLNDKRTEAETFF